jgi:dynein heavy chain
MRQTLEALRLGLQGLALMTSDLDQALELLDTGKVPPLWGSFYLSMKSLGPWMADFLLRIEAIKNWAEGASPPKAFWMGGFCDPIAFSAAVQQTAVRKLGAPYDALIWEFVIINSVESDIKVIPLFISEKRICCLWTTHNVLQAGPREGVFVKGLLLEGAGWDMDFATLVEAPPMKVFAMSFFESFSVPLFA